MYEYSNEKGVCNTNMKAVGSVPLSHIYIYTVFCMCVKMYSLDTHISNELTALPIYEMVPTCYKFQKCLMHISFYCICG